MIDPSIEEKWKLPSFAKMRPAEALKFLKNGADFPDVHLSAAQERTLGGLAELSAEVDLHETEAGVSHSGAFGRVGIFTPRKNVMGFLGLEAGDQPSIAIKIQRRDRYEGDIMMHEQSVNIRKRVLAKSILSSQMWYHEMLVGALLADSAGADAFITPIFYFESRYFNRITRVNEKTTNMIMPAYEPLGGPNNSFEEFIFNTETLYSLVLQVLAGLCEAQQSLGFVHRDLHMGNMFVKDLGKKKKLVIKLPGASVTLSTNFAAKIGDFGLSRAETDDYIINSLFDFGIARSGAFSYGADTAMFLGPSLAVSLADIEFETPEDYYFLLRLFLGIDTSDWPTEGGMEDVIMEVLERLAPHYDATRPKETFSAGMLPLDEVRLVELAKRAGFRVQSLKKVPRKPLRAQREVGLHPPGVLTRYPHPFADISSLAVDMPWLVVSDPLPGVHIARVDLRSAREAGFELVTACCKIDPGDFIEGRPGLAFNGGYFSVKYAFSLLGFLTPKGLPDAIPELYREFFGSVVVTDTHALEIDTAPPPLGETQLVGVTEFDNHSAPTVIRELAPDVIPAGPVLVKNGRVVFGEDVLARTRTTRHIARALVAMQDEVTLGEVTDEDDVDEEAEDFLEMGMEGSDPVSVFSCAQTQRKDEPLATLGGSEDSEGLVESEESEESLDEENEEYRKIDGVWTRLCTEIEPGELVHAAQGNPRTALLLYEDDVFEVVVVDGARNANEGTPGHETEGMTLSELAEFAASRGAKNAINLDGGISSNFAWSDGTSVRCSSHTFSYPVGQIFAVVSLSPEEHEDYLSRKGAVPYTAQDYAGA